MDHTLLLDLNHLTRHSSVLNDAVRLYGEAIGLLLLLCCVALLAIASRQGGIGGSEGPGRSGIVTTVLSGAIAYGIARIAGTLIGRTAPAGSGLRLLVLFRDGTHTMPDALTAAAFGITGTLALVGARRLAIVAVLLAVLEALAVVTAAAAWPSDVGVGALLGLLTSAMLALGLAFLAHRTPRTAPAGAHNLVLGVEQGRSAVDGPAAHRIPDEGSGAVRILSSGTVRPAPAPERNAPRSVPSS